MLGTMGYSYRTYVVLLVLSAIAVVAPRSNICQHDGKKFLVVTPVIHPASDAKTHHLVIQGTPGAAVTVTLPWNDTFKEKLPENGQITFHTNDSRLNVNFTHNAVQKVALFISCPVVINVFVYSDGADGYAAVQMPSGVLRQDLTHKYVVASYKVQDGCKAFVAVAAISDNTLVNGTVRVEAGGKVFYGSQELEDRESFTNIRLGALHVLFIWSQNDLTGTVIFSSTYVSVFSGFDCTCGTDWRDRQFHGIMTQMPPHMYLRHQHLPVPAFGFADDTTFRIMAVEPNTTILKPSNKTFRTTLNLVGDFVDMHSATELPGVIRGDKPILVMSYAERTGTESDCLSLMTLVRPGMQFVKTLNVYAIPSVDMSVLIIHPVSPSNHYAILINDTIVDTLESFAVSSQYVALRTEIEPGSHVIASANRSARINVYVYGKSHSDFYSFIGACFGTDEEDEGEEEVSASLTIEALEYSTSSVQIPAARSLLPSSGNYIRTSPGPSATVVSPSDPLTPLTSLDPATSLESSEHSDKLAPSKASDSLHLPNPTKTQASCATFVPSDPSATLVPSVPSAILVPSDPSATLVPSVPSATLVPSVPSATLVPSDPSATLVPSVPSATLVPSVPSATLVPSDPSATLVPSVPSATLVNSDLVTLEASDPSATFINLEPVTLVTSDPSGTLMNIDPATLVPSDLRATLVNSDPVFVVPSDPSATLVNSDPATLSSPRRLCPCLGTSTKQDGSVHQSVLALGKSELTLYTKSLSSHIRKRISSYDGRTSSKAFGYTGMVVVFAPLLIVFVCDARLFMLHLAGKT